MWYSKGYYTRYIRTLELPHIKDIVGVRRCGKTTVLYQVMAYLFETGVEPKNVLFLNFDDMELATTDFNEIMDYALRH